MVQKSNATFFQRTIIGIAMMLAIAIIGISYRLIEAAELRHATKQQAIVNVAVLKATAEQINENIILPGNIAAWHETTIYARTNGYVIKWMVDIGARVKKGMLLALLSAPEVDAQLRQTEAELKTAKVDYQLAHTTAVRWINLLKSESVSVQETNEKIADEKAKAAIVKSTRGQRDRLRALVSFQRIVAPFDGIIMSRTTDIGRLINAGSGTVALFRLVQAARLRVYVKVPEYYSLGIVPNLSVELYFSEHPGKRYVATLLDTAKAIDRMTRTLLVQFQINNPNYELLSGSYTEVHLKLPINGNYVRLPVNTLIFREKGMQVASIDASGKALLKSITIGRDFGDQVEVTSGIHPGELVIINPPDSLFSGEKVRIVSTKSSNKEVPS